MENKEKINIVWVDIKELKSSEYNPRKLTDKEGADLMESIKRFGMVEPIIVNGSPERKNIIIGGHQRYFICKEMGFEKIPVVYLDIADIEKEKELNLRLNKNTGSWDWNLLGNFDENLLLDVGFASEEMIGNNFDIPSEIEKGIFFKGTEDKSDNFQMTILINKKYQTLVKKVIDKKGKSFIVDEIIKLCQNADLK